MKLLIIDRYRGEVSVYLVENLRFLGASMDKSGISMVSAFKVSGKRAGKSQRLLRFAVSVDPST